MSTNSPDEQNAIDAAIQRGLVNAQGKGLRGAHPRAHGCVHARFTVDPSALPPEAQAGVFKEARTFDAWIRFSNAQPDPPDPPDDRIPDVRGMAIKLLGVEGTKLLEKERDEKTQDFILISHPTFFARTAKQFLTVLGLATDQLPLPADQIQALKVQLAREMGILADAQKSPMKNPLGGEYWSTVPFRLGSHRVKYHARPIAAAREVPASRDFLREAMKAQLDKGDAGFVFSVQLFQDEATTPVDDPTVPWNVPFVPVATIVIPAQDFSSNERTQFCENLSFTPWHSLPEHEPLGAINLARKPIYDKVSEERHKATGAPRVEPK